jgi:hypothetical protein
MRVPAVVPESVCSFRVASLPILANMHQAVSLTTPLLSQVSGRSPSRFRRRELGYADHAREGEVANNCKHLTRKVHRLDRTSIPASISEEWQRDNPVYRSLSELATRQKIHSPLARNGTNLLARSSGPEPELKKAVFVVTFSFRYIPATNLTHRQMIRLVV